jgi:hypothetical protein
MKSAGLSSKIKKNIRHNTKATAFAANHVNHLAAKEKQKSLRLQAEQAQMARMKKESQTPATS